MLDVCECKAISGFHDQSTTSRWSISNLLLKVSAGLGIPLKSSFAFPDGRKCNFCYL